jgi:hypothetical protein
VEAVSLEVEELDQELDVRPVRRLEVSGRSW